MCGLSASGAMAQDAGRPLSVIDWLSNSVARPVALPLENDSLAPDVAGTALPPNVTVLPLDAPSPDAVGLLPPEQSGLPADLWGQTPATSIAAQLSRLDLGTMLPALRDLVRTILLAELDPPVDTSPDAALFLARLDTLMDQGALFEAEALINRAGTPRADVFRRWFDLRLLLGSGNDACAKLRVTPDLSPTFPARIFCLARSGDWDAAALTLETAEALGMLLDTEDELLARFLHVELGDDAPTLLPATNVTPLTFRLYEAIGEPLATGSLPLAFAQADLRDNIGWKPRIKAAERLARVGSIAPKDLQTIYTEHRPAASGAPWNRVEAYQQLLSGLERNNPAAVAKVLPTFWALMEEAELEIAVAQLHGAELAALPLDGDARDLALRIGLLSPDYESIATDPDVHPLLGAIARGQAPPAKPVSAFARAIVEGFVADDMPDDLADMAGENRLGEAILTAVELIGNGAQGNLDDLVAGIAFLRNAGLEDTSRKVALQLMLLERRG